jgi:hypothetical protein
MTSIYLFSDFTAACLPDGPDAAEGPQGSLFDAAQHVAHPRFPDTVFSDSPQSAVIIALVLDDEPAEVEHRDMQEPRLQQVEC